MKKILLTLLIYIAYCIFVQCENDKLQESLVIATILSKTVNTVDPITLNENKKMQLLEENSNVFRTPQQPKPIRNIQS